jgi:hypothetical protein
MNIKLRGIEFENFANYKKPAMFLAFPNCNGFKCGAELCQNSPLAQSPLLEYPVEVIVDKYMENHIAQAVVIGGLEPLDDFPQLLDLIHSLRYETDDDIVIYTGYTEEEAAIRLPYLTMFDNIIIKFGRYIPNQQPHYDEVLGVNLASNNQYAKRVS